MNEGCFTALWVLQDLYWEEEEEEVGREVITASLRRGRSFGEVQQLIALTCINRGV